MARTVYLNGGGKATQTSTRTPTGINRITVDAVYEVTSVLGGRLVDFPGHLARLRRSLAELAIDDPLTDDEYLAAHRELMARDGIEEGMIYLQVSRGNGGDRDFVYPPPGTRPTVVMYGWSKPGLAANPAVEAGWRVVSLPDLRWHRRDIKTVQLLWPSMCKMEAKARGVDDAWLVEDGLVTEGTSNNAYIVRDGRIVTRSLSNDILHGITRAAILRLAAAAQIEVEERSFTIAEAQAADEAFVTSASAFVMPVVEIDGVPLGDGRPGPVARRLREIYLEEGLRSAI